MRIGAPLLLALVLGACGDKPQGAEPSGLLLAPGDPEGALAWVEEVEDDDVQLRARLDAWPLAGEAFEYADETQIAWTWRLQLALRDGDVERAGVLVDLLADRFEGRGQYPEGRDLSARAVRLGVFEEARLTARRRIEGVRPDPEAAGSALAVAERMLRPEDKEDRQRLEGARAWVTHTSLQQLLATVGSSARVSPDVQATLVILADDFTLGESVFLGVLGQWGVNHADARFERLLVPLLRGQVRYGLRLVPADSREAELASIEKRCAEADLACRQALPVDRLAALGLGEGDAALILADGSGRIVARLCGRNPDPRVLEPALQRLLSR